jgi:hypothetical protein
MSGAVLSRIRLRCRSGVFARRLPVEQSGQHLNTFSIPRPRSREVRVRIDGLDARAGQLRQIARHPLRIA